MDTAIFSTTTFCLGTDQCAQPLSGRTVFSDHTALATVDLNVRFLRDSNDSVLHGTSRIMSAQPGWLYRVEMKLRLHGGPIREAIFGQHDLFVLSGLYTSLTFLCCAWFLHCRGKRWALWWERPRARDPRRGQSLLWQTIHAIKDSIRSWLLRSADLVIGIGTVAVTEYQAMGVSPDRLRMLPYSCDVSRFGQVDDTVRENERARFGWSNQLVLLFSGQMIHRKGVDVLLRAFERVARLHPDVVLRLLGDGEDRQHLEALVPRGPQAPSPFRRPRSSARTSRTFCSCRHVRLSVPARWLGCRHQRGVRLPGCRLWPLGRRGRFTISCVKARMDS